ncbi:MAG: extracellular solute-binding protein [Thermoguttaceae bacterium]|jgi:iron(III) transport system substrate-binding protein|nr:extracellular solute-binding protein [Thermoguttaceae bacterium]
MNPRRRNPPWNLAILGLLAILSTAGCWSRGPSEVVVYTALDSEFSEPILGEFTKQTGFVAVPKFDTEATKTVGLAQAILAERDRPRCDVFWNNEILNTLRLEREGLLEPYQPPAAAKFPATYRSPEGTWHGFAARARVLVVNTKLLPEADRPRSIGDLADRKWQGKAGMAKPLAGTTATHAACLFAAWGDDRAKEFFRKVKANDVRILSGNKQVAIAVARGQLAFGLTDTDDALVEREQGQPVAIVYPDQGPEGIGTLVIPNTLAIIKGGPNPEGARRLVDYLLTADVEAKLSSGPSAQIPLHEGLPAPARLELPADFKRMDVDFAAAAARWDAAARFIREEFTGAE